MSKILTIIQRILNTRELRTKLLFTLGIFAVFRLLAHIPVPGVDIIRLQEIFATSQFLNFLNIFAGGTLANFSIVTVGINPYITASIVMQLSTMVIPQLKEMQKEGESGRERLNQYSRLLTVPLAVVQSVSVITLLRSQNLLETTNPIALVALITSLVAGAMLVMWLGELLTLYGVGNGISMILLAGILSQVPMGLAQLLAIAQAEQMTLLLSLALLGLGVVALIVFMNEAIRKIVIQYAKRLRGSRMIGGQLSHLPIRVNVAGVMPIIFGVSIMLAPSFIARILTVSGNQALVAAGQQLSVWFSPTSPVYMMSYFVIVFVFTFFSALLFFNAGDISEELKKSGAFVPGIRPGGPTKKYLEFVVSRITLAGAIFLSSLAVLPSLAQAATGITALAVGGTSVLIVVSVILETNKQIQSLLVGQDYERYV